MPSVEVDRDDLAALVRLRPFLASAASHFGQAGDPRVRAGLAALVEADRVLRSSDYSAATSATLPQRPGDGWVSVMDAATRLGISERAVRYRIGAGTLRGARDRRGWWRVDPSDLEASR